MISGVHSGVAIRQPRGRDAQRENYRLFVVPPVLQGNGSIPRGRRFVFARECEKNNGVI